MHEVHALPVDPGGELRQGVQFALAGPPVEAVVPVGNELAQVVRVGTGLPGAAVRSGKRVRANRSARSRSTAAGTLMVKGDGVDGEDMNAPW
jgi:hypothetical protein